jgi:two-component system response regulator AtoC
MGKVTKRHQMMLMMDRKGMGDADRIRILIAEDEAGLIKALATYLHREDRQLLLAHDGAEAVRLLDEHAVEIVLTDLVMPGVDGMGVLQKSLEINPQTIVILMTGYGSIDTAVRAMKEGAFDYKAKPFLLEEIGLSVQRAEAHLRLRRERDRLAQEMDSLRQRLFQLERELDEIQSSNASGKGQKDFQIQRPLHILRNRLDPHEASSSYQQWEPDSTLNEDKDLLRWLRSQGAISLEQYRRLSRILLRGRELVS